MGLILFYRYLFLMGWYSSSTRYYSIILVGILLFISLLGLSFITLKDLTECEDCNDTYVKITCNQCPPECDPPSDDNLEACPCGCDIDCSGNNKPQVENCADGVCGFCMKDITIWLGAFLGSAFFVLIVTIVLAWQGSKKRKFEELSKVDYNLSSALKPVSIRDSDPTNVDLSNPDPY